MVAAGAALVARIATLSPGALSPMALAPLAAAPALGGCGGCPWISNSEVTVTPAAACLVIEAAGSGDDCVDPNLHGTNTCDDTLTISAAQLGPEATEDVVIAAGDTFDFEIAFERGEDRGEQYDWSVAAMLGDQPITISFITYAP